MSERRPVVDIGSCTLCLGCLEVAPDVFKYNSDLNIIEVVDLQKYPEAGINEAIKICPADCIEWE